MTSKKKLILIGAVLGALLGGGSLLYNSLSGAYQKTEQQLADQTTEQTPPPSAAPTETRKVKYADFSLETLDGRTVSLSDYEGESAFVLNFWASWCGPCKAEMPHFEKLEREYNEKGVVFLMVNLTDGVQETKESAETYLEEAELRFDNVLLDVEGEASYIYSVSSIPATYIFDREGTYVKGFRGTITEETLRTELEKIADGS